MNEPTLLDTAAKRLFLKNYGNKNGLNFKPYVRPQVIK